MRMMMKVQMDTEAASRAIADGSLPQVMGETLRRLNPEAAYFAVDLVTRDQVESYAARKGWPVSEAERWLAPNLGYDAG